MTPIAVSPPLPGTPPLVISIQSQVVHGHVGNSAAVPALRALGVEVADIPTALLSNHPHYPTMRGRVLEPALVADLLTGALERGLGARAVVILSGFLGRAETGRAVADFVESARAANPGVIYACDPVSGDADLGFFATPDLREVFAEVLVPRADLILPNAFELAALSGLAIDGPDRVAEARARLGLRAVVATSVPVPGHPDRLATVSASAEGLGVTEAARLPVRPAGTGDLLAGLVAARLALGLPLARATAMAAEALRIVLEATARDPWAEMPLTALLPRIVAAEAPGGEAGGSPG